MTDPVTLRREVAERVGRAYAALDGVAAVALTGSVARGHADRFSDSELLVVWEGEPSHQGRASVVDRESEDHRMLPDEDELFVGRDDSGEPNTGLLIEVVHMRRDSVEEVLRDVLDNSNASLDLQPLVHALANAQVIAGDALVSEWAARTHPYPVDLRRAMVNTYAQVDNFWRHEMWLARSNPLMQREQLVGIQKQMLVVLQAVNGRYHFGFKWVDRLIDELTVAPEGLRELVASTDPEDVRVLIEDVYDLCEAHDCDVDVDQLRRIFRWRRTPWP